MWIIRKIGSTIGVMFGVALLVTAALFSGWRVKSVQTPDGNWLFWVLLVFVLVFGCGLLVLKFLFSRG
jgi:hypothetical protein